MDTMSIILCVIIAFLLIERTLDRTRMLRMQDMLNRALIAKTVPEYDYTNKGEIKKMKVENDLAMNAQKILDEQESKLGPHFPIT